MTLLELLRDDDMKNGLVNHFKDIKGSELPEGFVECLLNVGIDADEEGQILVVPPGVYECADLISMDSGDFKQHVKDYLFSINESIGNYFTPLTFGGFGGGGDSYFTPPMPYYEDGVNKEKLPTFEEFLLDSDELIGGVADGMDLTEIAQTHGIDTELLKKQLKLGIQVEMEHTDDPQIASEIARDHLQENPDYYKELMDAGLVDEPVDMNEDRLPTFEEFDLQDKPKYSKGCVMLRLFEGPDWDAVIEMIQAEDVYDDGSGKFGREKAPHVTILYGLLSDQIDTQDVIDYMCNADFPDWKILSNQISIFDTNPDYDVVKFDVLQGEPGRNSLVDNNELIKEKFPYQNDYPDYKPHITIAYVKKGMGQKYVKTLEQIIEFKVKSLQYSCPTERWTVINSIIGKVPFPIVEGKHVGFRAKKNSVKQIFKEEV